MQDKQFLYKLTLTETYKDPNNWTEKTTKAIEEHAAFIHELGRAGVLILAGRTQYTPQDERLFGIALIKAKDMAEAQEILKNDPGVVNGIQAPEFFEFNIGMNYTQNL